MIHMLRIPRVMAMAVRAGCLIALFAVSAWQPVLAQGIHFSQYYNAPMLASPANAGLMPDKDYRLGANYRTQWGAVPVPFNTFSAYGDLQLFRREEGSNWLGMGGAIFSDKGGDGNLASTRVAGFVAYHLALADDQMISFGMSAASVQRSVDFTKLSFDAQWDGFEFNTTMPNNEMGSLSKASYADIGAGLNYAYYPSEQLYVRVGAGLDHINRPKESFTNQVNQVGLRSSLNIDVVARVGDRLIINPSAYYTMQKGAWQLMYGSLLIADVGAAMEDTRLIFGAYNRWNDALVGALGMEWKDLRIMASFDYTISGLGQFIRHNGAFELGIGWQGHFRNNGFERRRAYNCPRF